MNTSVATDCPVCGASVSIQSDVILSELLDCRDCGSELEVTALKPAIQLVEAPDSAEDWGE